MYEGMNVKNILLGGWQNLLNIKRLSVRQVISPLTVAEHSWLVAMLVMRMCDEIFEEARDKLTLLSERETFTRNKNEMVKAALVHDMEEAIIGDIPRIPCIRDTTYLLKIEAIHLINKDLFDDVKGLYYGRLRVLADDYTLVKYCDLYSLLIECIREIEIGNNTLIEVAGKALYLMEELVNKDNVELEPYVAKYIKENYENTRVLLGFQRKPYIRPIKW